MSGFKSFPERLKELNVERNIKEQILNFGNPFLDDSLGGIFPGDLIVTTGKTGAGKTELVTQIATTNALKNKNVHLFALEAEKNEIESRIKFKKLSEAFYIQKNWRDFGDIPNYQEWKLGKNELLRKFEPEVDEECNGLKSLFTFYREETDFNIETFESHFHRIAETTDLVIMDHLHYFDFEEENENVALKKTIKGIRNIQSDYRKPVILVVHLRKLDKRSSGLIPDIEDIHGSSDISKIATRVITTASAHDTESVTNIYPTYFRILKNRMDSSRCRFVGLCGFDISRNTYLEQYKLCELNFENTETKFIDPLFGYPRWVRQY